jgi:hypothetical protein
LYVCVTFTLSLCKCFSYVGMTDWLTDGIPSRSSITLCYHDRVEISLALNWMPFSKLRCQKGKSTAWMHSWLGIFHISWCSLRVLSACKYMSIWK